MKQELTPEQTAKLNRAIDEHAEGVKIQCIENIDLVFSKLQEISESPIEALLGGYLLLITDGYNTVEFYADPTGASRSSVTRFGSQITLGSYRVDFLFCVTYCGRVRLLIVECDGHDFHERTKEQARRDRQRDRFFLSKGVSVMRFTGSEIFRDPEACATEVETQLSLLVESIFREEGLIRRARETP